MHDRVIVDNMYEFQHIVADVNNLHTNTLTFLGPALPGRLVGDSTFVEYSRRLSQCIEYWRSRDCGGSTSSQQVDSVHHAPVSWCSKRRFISRPDLSVLGKGLSSLCHT